MIETTSCSCDAALFDAEGIVIGLESNVKHLRVPWNWVDAENRVLTRCLHSEKKVDDSFNEHRRLINKIVIKSYSRQKGQGVGFILCVIYHIKIS